MVAFVEGKPQGHNQQLFQAQRGAGYQGDPSLAKIIEERKICWDKGAKFSIEEQKIGFQGRHGAKL